MQCDICCSFPLHELLKYHQLTKHNPLLTVMGTVLSKDEEGNNGTGRFIFDEGTHEVLHYVDSQGADLNHFQNGYMKYQYSNLVNCGVYLFTVSDLYKEPLYKDFGEKYARILAISKDDNQERSLS